MFDAATHAVIKLNKPDIDKQAALDSVGVSAHRPEPDRFGSIHEELVRSSIALRRCLRLWGVIGSR